MDPTANLERQIVLARQIREMLLLASDNKVQQYPEYQAEQLAERAAELSDLVIALADWTAAGGFSPAPRARNPRPLLDSLALVRAATVKARLVKEHTK